MLNVISAQCVCPWFAHDCAGPLERTWWRRFTAQWEDCQKSWITPLNAIIISITSALFLSVQFLTFLHYPGFYSRSKSMRKFSFVGLICLVLFDVHLKYNFFVIGLCLILDVFCLNFCQSDHRTIDMDLPKSLCSCVNIYTKEVPLFCV